MSAKVLGFVGAVVILSIAPILAFATEGKIAFCADEKLYVMDPSTGGTVRVPIPSFDAVRTPKWSRDGNWLTFTAGLHEEAEIHVVRPDGSGFRQVTNIGWAVSPSFSPDGATIAFTQVYGDLFTVGFDGYELKDLGFLAGTPEWSPDGTRISYTNWALPSYDSDIFIYDIGLQTSTQITSHASGQAFSTPSWSPDSSMLLVSELSNGEWDVWRMDSDGHNPTNLTEDLTGSDESWACWSPDGQSVVFRSTASGNWDIWSMLPDGNHRVNLTSSPTVDEGPPSAGIPEPSTLSLLALSGVGLIRRRPR